MSRIPCELAEHADQDLQRIRAMSLEEHGRVLDAVCSAAVDIYEGRLKMGLPPNQPEPWPESTLQFFRRHAPNARKSASA